MVIECIILDREPVWCSRAVIEASRGRIGRRGGRGAGSARPAGVRVGSGTRVERLNSYRSAGRGRAAAPPMGRRWWREPGELATAAAVTVRPPR